MYKCDHFDIEELVSKAVYVERGNKAWALLDNRALKTLDQLRKRFGPVTVNDWKWGGKNEYRGLREPNCKIGAAYSQHRFGRAFDCHFRDVSAHKVREYILQHPEEFPYITALEMGVSWLHFDVRNHGDESILKFYPKV